MHTQNVKGAALESKETGGNSTPLTPASLSHCSTPHSAYFNAPNDELAGQEKKA